MLLIVLPAHTYFFARIRCEVENGSASGSCPLTEVRCSNKFKVRLCKRSTVGGFINKPYTVTSSRATLRKVFLLLFSSLFDLAALPVIEIERTYLRDRFSARNIVAQRHFISYV